MKRTIERLAVGQVNEKRPSLTLYREQEAFCVEEDKVYEGSLTFLSDGQLRGRITTSNYRMETERTEFAGRDMDIAYRFDGRGLKAGEIVQGSFLLITNAGEYEVPFTATIEEPYLMAEEGRLTNLSDFAAYAPTHGPEACQIFRKSAFRKLLREETPQCRQLYERLRKAGPSELDMEEFLIYAGKKRRIELSLSEYGKEWADPAISMKSVIRLEKSTWGCVPIEVLVDGDFLTVEKKRISAEDFTGKYYELAYVIERERLHAGNNYGALTISTPWQSLTYTVTVKNRRENKADGGTSSDRAEELKKRGERKMVLKLLEFYVEFRLKRRHRNVWTRESIALLERLRGIRPGEERYSLLEAQMFLAEGRREEAGWLLDQFSNRKKKNREPEVLAYFLYLCAIYKANEDYTQEACEEIKRLYAQEKGSAYMLWFLLYMDERLTGNPEKKLELIERQCRYGSRSTMLYLEACLLYREEPSLLREFNDFTFKILEFAVRKKALTPELCSRIAQSAMRYRGYSPRLFKILTACQLKMPSRELLTAIIRLLMRGNRTDKESFYWYALGVMEDLRITRLYEYYMLSLDASGIDRLPKTLLMYFSYNSQLEDKKLAMLYDYVIREEEEQPAMFREYKSAMQKFMVEQLLMRRVNSYVLPIYRRFLTEEILNEPMREALAQIVYTHEVTVERSGISSVQVLCPGAEERKAVPCQDGRAYVQLPTHDYVLIFTDTRGRRLAGSVPYRVRPLFEERSFLDMCGAYLPAENGENTQGRIARLEVLMEDGHYGKVYESLKREGLEGFPPKRAAKLAGRMLREPDYENDRFLLYLCRYAFARGYYDRFLLEYLAEYLEGSCAELAGLFEEAVSFGADLGGLEERLLVQLLFTGLTLPAEEKIFCRYVERGGREMVKKAFINERCAGYFVNGEPLFDALREEMQKRYAARGALGDSGRLALIKYYAENKNKAQELEKKEVREMLVRFLREFAGRGRYFRCFFDYPRELLREAGIPALQVVEYHAAADVRVKLQYQAAKEESCQTEDMVPAFPGVFVKCFSLGYGESLDYVILEETDGGTVRREAGRAAGDDCPADDDYSREAFLFRIRTCGNGEERKALMAEYERRKQLVADVFRMR